MTSSTVKLARMVCFTGIILLLLASKCLAVQPYTPVHPDPVLESWRWRAFPELNGLGLRCMAEAKDGAMWFGVDTGVVRYDGVTWTTFTEKDGLYGAPVTALLGAQDGSVYAGSPQGISQFKAGRWQRVFPAEGDSTAWRVYDVMEARNGSLWAGTSKGAVRFFDGRITLYTTDSLKTAQPGLAMEMVLLPEGVDVRVHNVYEDREGRMWFGLYDGEILCGDMRGTEPDDPVAWQHYTEADGLNIGRGRRIVQTQDGTIWTVSRGKEGGVNRFDPSAESIPSTSTSLSTGSAEGPRTGSKTWTPLRLSDLGGTDHNAAIVETKDGTVWIGGYEYHSYSLHAFRKGVWSLYKTSDIPVPGDTIIGLWEASDGALWIAGEGQEVVRLDYATNRWTTFDGLSFRHETADRSQWFVSQDSTVVRYDGRVWLRYGVEDGLMDFPMIIVADRKGDVWASGSHDSIAATARFDGKRWIMQTHPRLAGAIFSSYADPNGSVWFGAYERRRDHLGGFLEFDGKDWIHHTPPGASIGGFYSIGQTADGALYFGGWFGLRRFDPSARPEQAWTMVTEPVELSIAESVNAIHTTPEGELWVGNRAYGAFHYDGQNWTRYDIKDGLAGNNINGILQASDKSVWAATSKGISRFDGQTWTTHALPPELKQGLLFTLHQSRDGAIWVNQWRIERGSFKFWTIRYAPDGVSPETEITLSVDEVSQPGNTTLAWKGVDAWKATPDEEIQYAYRLNGGTWSAFSHRTNEIFQALSSGRHTFEVKARDRDFNEDATPARVAFVVVPPVWQQPWFIGLMVVLGSAIGFQTVRVVRRDRRLRTANAALSAANRELFEVNTQLQGANREIQAQTQRKSAFLASMSHELRTPMNAIMGFTRLVLRREPELTPRGKENLEKVGQASDHLMGLINDILDLSKIEAGKMDVAAKRFDVKHLIAQCISTVSPLVKDGVALRCEVEEGIGEAFTDEGRVRQMVINLLSNAIKFTDRGEVKVTAKIDHGRHGRKITEGTEKAEAGVESGKGDHGRQTTDDEAFQRVNVPAFQRSNAILEIVVSDTGVGIPADKLGSIFEEFVQVGGSESSVQKGTGLGLSITKKFAELLGGNINVESEVGKGSTFTIRLPSVYKA